MPLWRPAALSSGDSPSFVSDVLEQIFHQILIFRIWNFMGTCGDELTRIPRGREFGECSKNWPQARTLPTDPPTESTVLMCNFVVFKQIVVGLP